MPFILQLHVCKHSRITRLIGWQRHRASLTCAGCCVAAPAAVQLVAKRTWSSTWRFGCMTWRRWSWEVGVHRALKRDASC